MKHRLSVATAVVTMGILSTAAGATPYPNIRIQEEKGGSNVYWDSQLLVELKQNRYLRFRATPLDEKWVGSQRKGADLCWAYADSKAKGMEVLGTAHENHPERGEFSLVVRARKPQCDGAIRVVLTGTWMPDASKFRYTLTTSLECPLESWYQNSTEAQRAFAHDPKSRPWIEVVDYHIEYMSAPDRNLSVDHKEPQMYEWFVKSHDGKNWTKSPKIHIPFPVRQGNYVTISDPANLSLAGGYYGFLDRAHGGWMTRVVKSPGPVSYGLCWYFFDVHVMLRDGVPPRHSAEKLSLEFTLAFDPVEAPRSREIIAKAVELDWRTREEYKLPLFTRSNRFDTLITDLPGEDTARQRIWWASSYECYRDDTIGYDDHFSVTIKRDKPSAMPAAWTASTWGYPFEATRIKNRRFRFSAMVKTANCTGPARLGHASTASGDLFYGTKLTHNADGTMKTHGVAWEFSEQVTGTTDWRRVAMDIAIHDNVNLMILQQQGTGQSWFDNVQIEDLGPAQELSVKQ